MPVFERHEAGTFNWIECTTTDQNGAKAFYTSLFGWTFADYPMGPESVYTMFLREGRTVGAACALSSLELHGQPVPPHWNLYIATDDADGTAARAVEFGGRLIAPPFDVYEFGRMAVIQDPTGAVFCVWQAKTHIGVSVRDEFGSVCWCDLNTSDPAKAAAFYAGVFGWTTEAGQGDYLHIRNGEKQIGGIGPLHDPNTPPHWMIYFWVANCDAATAQAKQLGGRALVEPFTMEKVGRIAILADPQGCVFALYQSAHA